MSASLAPECNEVKEWVCNPDNLTWWADSLALGVMIRASWNGTARVWYSPFTCGWSCWPSLEYLRGNATTDECSSLFKEYRQCLAVSHIFLIFQKLLGSDFKQGALKERGIDKMLEEAREDNKESDALNMRRKCKWYVFTSLDASTAEGVYRNSLLCTTITWLSSPAFA